MTSNEEFNPYQGEPPSKSEIKRQMLALQALGERLVGLPDNQLAKIPMPEQLSDTVYRARGITKRGGLRRELQYIGKVMRSIDITPIEQALEQLDQASQSNTDKFHALEQWRERLLHSPEALTEFLSLYPDCDSQLLRQLVRNHGRAKNDAQKQKAYRQLFKLIKETISTE